MRRVEWLWQDVRYAVRSLRRARGLTAAAVLTLALGIGATTTIFSLFQAVLLRRLPVESPGQLYFVAHGLGDPLSTSSHYPWLERVRQHGDVFAGVTAYNIRDLKVSSGGSVERVTGQYVSGNYHAVVGVPFELGRGFVDEDDRRLSPIAVISDRYWARQYGRSRDVIGKTLIVGGEPAAIVGVTAAAFDGMQPGQSIDVTLPLSVRVAADPKFLTATDTWTSMPLVVRLRPDVDAARARSAIASTYRDFMSLPDQQRFSRTATGELREATLLPAAQGSDRLRRGYEAALYVLAAMVSLVLVVACVNVANLLLTTAPSRAREVAVRMSLGAGRGRIVQQLLAESMLLAVGGGLLGVLLAAWGTRFVSVLLQMGMRPIMIDLQPHTGVLLFALGLSILTGIAFGLAPAWKTSGVDSRSVAQGRDRLAVGLAAAGPTGAGRGADRDLPRPRVRLRAARAHAAQPAAAGRRLPQGRGRAVRARRERYLVPTRAARGTLRGRHRSNSRTTGCRLGLLLHDEPDGHQQRGPADRRARVLASSA